MKAQEIPGDTLRISLKYKDAALSHVLADIMTQVKKTYIYRNDDIKGHNVSVDLKDVLLKTALGKVLESTGLEFTQLPDDGIAIVKSSTRSILITGSVEDVDTGRMLPGANILVVGSKQGTVSDESGNFQLIVNSTGIIRLIIRYMGYSPQTVSISGQRNKISVALRKTVVSGHGITVTASRAAMSANGRLPVSEISIAPLRVQSWPGLGDADVVRALEWAAGVHGSNDGLHGLSIRGGESSENLVLLDGIPIHQPDHLMGLISVFNSDALHTVRLLKGGAPARFGGCTSGVLECTGQSGMSESISIRGRLSSLCMQGGIAIPVGKRLSAFVNFRRAYQAALNRTVRNHLKNYLRQSESELTSIVQDSSGNGRNMNFDFYDVNAKLSWLPTEKDVFSFSFYQGGDRLNQNHTYSFTMPSDTLSAEINTPNVKILDESDWKHWGASLAWYHNQASSSLTVLAATSNTRRLYVEGEENTDDALNSWRKNHLNGIDEHRIDIDYSMQYSNAVGLDFGLRMQNFKTRLHQQQLRQWIADPSSNAMLGAGYGEAMLNLPGWQIRIGGRFSYYNPLKKFYTEPRAAVEWALSSRVSLSAAWGRYYQFINRVENGRVLSANRSFWLQAGPSLKPGYAEHFIGGITYNIFGWNAGIEIYQKELDGTTILAQHDNLSMIVDERICQGRGRTHGIEFFLHKTKGSVNCWLNYTWSRTWHKFSALNNGFSFFANQDRRHAFKAVASWSYSGWSLNGTCLWTSGLPYTPVYNYTLEPFPGLIYAEHRSGPRNSKRLPNIQRLDISFSRSMHYRDIECEVGLSIYNLLNRKNVLRRRFFTVFNFVQARDTKMIGIMPAFFLKFHWGKS
ncbi:carboxypeptidase-like regulatory domain-containing protein [bacterium]|nr:carboxypeptidase-like regulatory domain-containing protein [bacterium]